MEKALILVDLENEWADEESEYYLGDVSKLLAKTNQLIDYCREEGYKIIFTRHVESDSEKEFADNTKSTEIFKEIHKKESDVIITKNKISPFYKTNLEKELEGIEEIAIAGILTNLCVRSLTQDAYDRDFKVTIISDCCQAFNEEIHNFTLKDLKETRPEINIVNLKDFIK